jgi:hypothetical protein
VLRRLQNVRLRVAGVERSSPPEHACVLAVNLQQLGANRRRFDPSHPAPEPFGSTGDNVSTTLLEVVRKLEFLSDEATICAAKPWTLASQAILVAEADDWGMSPEARELGLSYFLEVFVAREFLNGWTKNSDTEPTLQEKCARLIQYVVNDA